MPRPELELGEDWENEIERQSLERIRKRLEKEPITEDELWTEVVRALGAEKGVSKTASRLRQLYNLRYKRKISDSTANMAVLSNLKKVAGRIKERLVEEGVLKTDRIIQFGKNYHGYIFYKEKDKLKGKVEKIILESDSTASKILEKVNEKGYIFESELPFQRRLLDLASSLLEEFSLAKRSRWKGQYLIHKVGYSFESIELKKNAKSSIETIWAGRGWDVKKDFYAGTWVLGAEGPKIKKFKFDLVGFDSKRRQLHIGLKKSKSIDKGDLREFRMRAVEWGLPATLHAIAPDFSDGAEQYARSWGILLESSDIPDSDRGNGIS